MLKVTNAAGRITRLVRESNYKKMILTIEGAHAVGKSFMCGMLEKVFGGVGNVVSSQENFISKERMEIPDDMTLVRQVSWLGEIFSERALEVKGSKDIIFCDRTPIAAYVYNQVGEYYKEYTKMLMKETYKTDDMDYLNIIIFMSVDENARLRNLYNRKYNRSKCLENDAAKHIREIEWDDKYLKYIQEGFDRVKGELVRDGHNIYEIENNGTVVECLSAITDIMLEGLTKGKSK